MTDTAGTLHCPTCGALALAGANLCDHCGARLATVSCPACFGMMFVGEKFCSHCGAQAERSELPAATPLCCPRCRVTMDAVVVGTSNLRECPRCEGIWADAETLRKIYKDKEQQAALLIPGTPASATDPGEFETDVHYVPCPQCDNLMNRVNFARGSRVVVDVCGTHGTWFDKDELRRIVQFISDGGLEKARAYEISRLEEKRKEQTTVGAAGGSFDPVPLSSTKFDLLDAGLRAIAACVGAYFR